MQGCAAVTRYGVLIKEEEDEKNIKEGCLERTQRQKVSVNSRQFRS